MFENWLHNLDDNLKKITVAGWLHYFGLFRDVRII
jgi:hypothetical protein